MFRLIYTIHRIKKNPTEYTSDVLLVYWVFAYPDPLFTHLYLTLCPRRLNFMDRINEVPCSLNPVEFGRWGSMIGYQSVR